MLESSYVVLNMIRQLEDEHAAMRRAHLARAGFHRMPRATPSRRRSVGFEATLLGRRVIARLSLQPAAGPAGLGPPPPAPPREGDLSPGGWLGVWRVLRGM